MRDLVLSVLIGSIVVVGATDFAGVTNVFGGQSPATAIRDVVPVQDLPSLPALPSLPSLPDARAMLGGATATATGTATPPPPLMYVAHTSGAGVRPRLACADEAPGQGTVAEGTSVTVVRQGASECPGWALVSTGKIEFWVRMAYLDGAAPRASSSSKPVDVKPSNSAPVLPSPNGDATDLRERVEQERKRQEASESPPAPAPEPAPPTAIPTATSSPAPAATPTAEPRPKRTPVPTPTEEPRDDEN